MSDLATERMPELAPDRRQISRPMIFSWVIDGILATSIIAAVYTGGQFVERLDTVVNSLESLSTRVSQLEERPMGPAAAQRIAVLEAQDAHRDRALAELKADITSRLDRIENKIDRSWRRGAGE